MSNETTTVYNLYFVTDEHGRAVGQLRACFDNYDDMVSFVNEDEEYADLAAHGNEYLYMAWNCCELNCRVEMDITEDAPFTRLSGKDIHEMRMKRIIDSLPRTQDNLPHAIGDTVWYAHKSDIPNTNNFVVASVVYGGGCNVSVPGQHGPMSVPLKECFSFEKTANNYVDQMTRTIPNRSGTFKQAKATM